MIHHSNKPLWTIAVALVSAATAFGQTTPKAVQQPKEVIDAYRVCEQFEKLLAEDLDFARAFDATFAKNDSRRREIAIAEGEFDRDLVASVDTATLVDAFKSRMQLVFFLFPLMSPDGSSEEDEFFPPPIKAIYDRKPPQTAKEFASYTEQLKHDVADMRAHMDRLIQSDPRVAKRVLDFKTDLAKKAEPPTYAVKPQTSYSKGRVLGPNEEYYQIGAYALIGEGTEMKIIGLRFFTLF